MQRTGLVPVSRLRYLPQPPTVFGFMQRMIYANTYLGVLRTAKSKTKGLPICHFSQTIKEIVSEEELPQLLAEGWRFVAALSSGKCVVSMSEKAS